MLREIPEFCAGLRRGLSGDSGRAARRTARPARRNASGGISPLVRALFLFALIVLFAAASAVGIGCAWGVNWRRLPFLAEDPNAPHPIRETPEDAADDLRDILATDPDVAPREWTSIVFHHSATGAGGAQRFEAYHRAQKGWQSLGYDFVIGNGTATPDGAIETGPRWRRQESGAHANSTEYNEHGIGICLVGNFDLQPPTPAQLAAARSLARELARRCHIPPERLFGHGQIREGGGTACPGKLFPLEDLRRQIAGERP
jgi:hypothetical protein